MKLNFNRQGNTGICSGAYGLVQRRLAGLVTALLLAVAALPAHAECMSGNWAILNVNSDDSTQWPARYQSQHFAIRIQDANVSLVNATQGQTALDQMESIWRQYQNRVAWPEPYCDSTTKYKVNVFVIPNYGISGGGRDDREMGIWSGPGALLDWWGIGHEFGHALQFNTRGNRSSPYVGWFWEAHAQFMAHQLDYNRSNTNCSIARVANPHLYWGSTRDRYCSFQFLDFLKNKYGYSVINEIWTKAPKPEDPDFAVADPIATLASNQKWSQSQLNDEFGDWAMHNVNWDYIEPDGFDSGAAMRKSYGANTDVSQPNMRHRTTSLEAVDDSLNQYQVPNYWAPQRYGYNLVQLFPSDGASSITVKFRGVVQAQRPATSFGNYIHDPGYGNNPTDNSAPNSGWRWGLVAIRADGSSRYSPLQRNNKGNLTFAVESGDQSLWMVVLGAPTVHNKIFWDQEYASLYRYPWKVQLVNAKPAGFQPNVPTPTSSGRAHANGGGWIADGATVDASAYVGPHAQVLGGSVLGNARIEDFAIVQNGVVRDNAVISGMTNLFQGHTLQNNVKASTVMSTQGSSNAVFSGNVVLFGDLEHYCTAVGQGAYSGYLDGTACNNADPKWGGNRAMPPMEVTTATPAGFPADDAGTMFAVDKTALSFSAPGRAASAPQTVTIINIGSTAGSPGAIAMTGPYAFTMNESSCGKIAMLRGVRSPVTLAPGQSCTVSLVFRPLSKSTSSYSGALTVAGNKVGLTGTQQ